MIDVFLMLVYFKKHSNYITKNMAICFNYPKSRREDTAIKKATYAGRLTIMSRKIEIKAVRRLN